MECLMQGTECLKSLIECIGISLDNSVKAFCRFNFFCTNRFI